MPATDAGSIPTRSAGQRIYLLDLPPEIFQLVFKNLDLPSLGKAALVSRHLNALTTEHWRHLSVTDRRFVCAVNRCVFRGAYHHLDLILSNLPPGYSRSTHPWIRIDLDASLGFAAHLREEETVRILLKHGADVQANENKALRTAFERYYFDLIGILLEHGADLSAVTSEELSLVCQSRLLQLLASKGLSRAVEVLVAARERAEISIGELNSAFLKASRNGHVEVVRILLQHGADVHAHDDLALRDAAERGNAEIICVLIQGCADVHAREGLPLVLAAR